MDGYVLGTAVREGFGRSSDLSLPHRAVFRGFPSFSCSSDGVSVRFGRNTYGRNQSDLPPVERFRYRIKGTPFPLFVEQ